MGLLRNLLGLVLGADSEEQSNANIQQNDRYKTVVQQLNEVGQPIDPTQEDTIIVEYTPNSNFPSNYRVELYRANPNYAPMSIGNSAPDEVFDLKELQYKNILNGSVQDVISANADVLTR